MTMTARPPIIAHEWEADARRLPSERDFDPFGGDLDAQCAWRNFGGLTRSAAYERFQENPLYYQEDFMFMGGVAFVYYYPVIERFLLDAKASEEPDDRQAWILAHGIKTQFSGDNVQHVEELRSRIMALAEYVRSNLALYDTDQDEQERIDTAWSELESHLAHSAA